MLLAAEPDTFLRGCGSFVLQSTPARTTHRTSFFVTASLRAQVRQLFERFAASSSAAAADARFEFFKGSIWPRLAEAGGGRLLLVVPSYFDFVRLR
jgi:hypothetical protein